MEKKRILIADDEAGVRSLLSNLLSDNYHVDIVCDGKALYELGSINYDLIIADINMPEFSGLEAVELAKAFGNQSKVLFITGDYRYAETKFEVIFKPFSLKELQEKIKKLLESS